MRKPYFENSRVRVFCGDSLEVLAELKEAGETFDLLQTDPPYGINQANEKPSGVNAERAKAAYKDGLFVDDENYLRKVVRPIIDTALSISTLGIITGGVECWKVYPPLSRMGACTRLLLPASIHGGIMTIGLYGITASRKAILGSIAYCRTLFPNAASARRIRVRNRWSSGRSSCCAARTESRKNAYSIHSEGAERLVAPRKTSA